MTTIAEAGVRSLETVGLSKTFGGFGSNWR